MGTHDPVNVQQLKGGGPMSHCHKVLDYKDLDRRLVGTRFC
jgi:hypothetical protein